MRYTGHSTYMGNKRNICRDFIRKYEDFKDLKIKVRILYGYL